MVWLCHPLIQQVLVLQNWLNIASGLLTHLQKLLSIFSWEKSAFLPLRATYLPSPAPYPSPSVYLYYSLYLAVFLILFREQNKLSRNQSSVSTCLVVFVRRPTFSLGELHLAHAAKGMRQKGNPFTALSSHKKHNTHTSFCRLVLYQFYLPFNHCNLNTCPFLVSSSSLVENYSLLSHRSMKNILFSILRRETGLNLKLEWYVFALWAGVHWSCRYASNWETFRFGTHSHRETVSYSL